MINRALQQSARASAGVPMWALRRDGRESESRPRVSDGVELAAVGDCDAGTDDELRQRQIAVVDQTRRTGRLRQATDSRGPDGGAIGNPARTQVNQTGINHAGHGAFVAYAPVDGQV